MIWNVHQIEWIFSGVGVTALTLGWRWYRRISHKPAKSQGPPEMSMRILIVDVDHELQSKLINAGWVHTRQKGDIINLGDEEVLHAQVIFVTVKGVGATLFKEEGLALAVALKQRHPNKKIVLYGVEGSVELFYNVARELDAFVPKDAQLYDFVRLLEKFARELSR